MPPHLRQFLVRHEPKTAELAESVKAGLGGLIGIAAAGGLATATGMPFLLAPFGASAVLLFAQPRSPLAQPANVLGGYLLSVVIAVAMSLALPGTWWAAAVGVGLAIMAMSALRLTHPPAGAIPIVAITADMAPVLLCETVIAGGVMLVAIAAVFHRIPPRQVYPQPSRTGTVPAE